LLPSGVIGKIEAALFGKRSLKRSIWVGFLVVIVVGTGWVRAQTPNPISPTWEDDSVVPVEPSSSPEPPREPHTPSEAAKALDRRLHGPEIWRLPPVPAPPMLPALTLPPTETLPMPVPPVSPPVANAPLALSEDAMGDEKAVFSGSSLAVDKLWDGSLDLGLDGSEGNSETFNFRFGFHAARKHESNIFTLGIDYNKSTAQTKPTANRLFFDSRFEWLIHQSRWSWFLHETVEYDDFQSFNVRDTSDAGLGYRLIKNDTTTLVGRLGAGFSHEYGGPEDGRYIPEAVFGIQAEHRISKRQKFLGLVEYAPGMGDFLHYRIRAQAAWEILLDEERNLSMRLGVLDRYTSNSNGARPNDVDYALLLLWKF
jgi:hypothetical protein